MSTRARKSRNRIVNLRVRAANSLAAWDDTMVLDTNSVFVPVLDAVAFLEWLEVYVEQAWLEKLDHQFLDGGVLVRFRRKRDADLFRQALIDDGQTGT